MSFPVRALPRRLRTVTVLLCVAAALTVLPGATPSASAASPPELTDRQERVVLGLIDSACGDSWCEGDYRFDFRRLSCSWPDRRCTLTLKIAGYADQPLRWRRRSGELQGFRRYAQLVDVAPNGQQSLEPAFYRALTELIGCMEETMPVSAPLPMGIPASSTSPDQLDARCSASRQPG